MAAIVQGSVSLAENAEGILEKAAVYRLLGSLFVTDPERMPELLDRTALATLEEALDDSPDLAPLLAAARHGERKGRGGTVVPPEPCPDAVAGTSVPETLEDCYTMAGFKGPAELGLARDHVGVELLFIAHLRAGEAARLRAGDEEGAAGFRELAGHFMRFHVLPWQSRFFERLNVRGEEPLVAPLAALTQRYVLEDAESLGVV